MKNSTSAKMAVFAAMAMGMLGDDPLGYSSNRLHNGVQREYHPWDTISLSKAERRGKSFEELQAMRKAKWEAL